MPRAELAVTLPETTWIGRLSREFPEATFRVLAALPAEDHGVGLVEIDAADPQSAVDAISAADGVTVAESIRANDRQVLVQFETAQPLLLMSLRAAGVPLSLPMTIHDGTATLEATAARERLSELADQLRAIGLPFEVESIRGSVDTEELLTDRQRELLVAATEQGYYDTPRRCSLTELAESVGIAKSTASETLHRAEAAVIERFVADLPDGTLGE